MTRIEKGKFDPEEEPVEDKTHRLARSLLGSMPVLSGVATGLFESIIQDPYQRRRTEWLHELTDAINSIDLDVTELRDGYEKENAALTAVLQSTDIALKTGDVSIHRRLVSMVVNTIREASPNEELVMMYLSTIRQMTSSHFALLELIEKREPYEHGSELSKHEKELFKEIEGDPDISNDIPPIRLLTDLESFHLIYSPSESPWSSNETNYSTMKPTDFAEGLLEYVGDIE